MILSVRVRYNRNADFDPEEQIEFDQRLDFLPVTARSISRVKQFEFLYSDPEPFAIAQLQEEFIHGNS